MIHIMDHQNIYWNLYPKKMNEIVITIKDVEKDGVKGVDITHTFWVSGEYGPGLQIPPRTLAEQIGDAAWEQVKRTYKELHPQKNLKLMK